MNAKYSKHQKETDKPDGHQDAPELWSAEQGKHGQTSPGSSRVTGEPDPPDGSVVPRNATNFPGVPNIGSRGRGGSD